jgi:hypothetical protein
MHTGPAQHPGTTSRRRNSSANRANACWNRAPLAAPLSSRVCRIALKNRDALPDLWQRHPGLSNLFLHPRSSIEISSAWIGMHHLPVA